MVIVKNNKKTYCRRVFDEDLRFAKSILSSAYAVMSEHSLDPSNKVFGGVRTKYDGVYVVLDAV